MTKKMKGIYKGFKYISQIFVVKEQEMEIGYPTDVKHVAHIGWDGPSGSGPSWMNEFKTPPDFSTSIGTLNTEHIDPHPMPVTSSCSTQGIPIVEVTHIPKKSKRKKTKANPSPKSSSRQSKAARAKAIECEREKSPISQL